MVSLIQFFPVSKPLVEKSNRVGLFACCFLKTSPSEACEEGIVPVRETTANICTTDWVCELDNDLWDSYVMLLYFGMLIWLLFRD